MLHSTRARANAVSALVLAIVGCALACGIFGVLSATHPGLPTWAKLNGTCIQADFDGDGACDQLYLAKGRMEVFGSDGLRYVTPRNWIVADAFAFDFTGDGAREIALVVWKRGSFGPSQPFWVEHDTAALTQHVFVMRFAHGSLEGVWMSSDLGEDARNATFDSQGRLHLVAADGTESVWQWEQWGFTLLEDHETATLLAVGDNIMHLSLCDQMYDPDTRTYDFSPVLEHVASRIQSYDLAAVCQETTLVHDRSAISDYPDFGTPEEVGDALAGAGFDIVAAATNHAYDKGMGGLEDTLAFWGENHPEVTLLGLHENATDACTARLLKLNGIRLAFFDATYGLNGHALPAGQTGRIDTLDDVDRLVANVKRAEDEADQTVCFLHIGDEYAASPTEGQRQTVESLVDAGADLVICSHPHVVQPVERVHTESGGEAVVYWSLGNFASHQADARTVLGGAATVVFERNGGDVAIASFGIEPTVCHFDERETAVYFLDDYTEDLARAHSLNAHGQVISVASLHDLWNAETSAGNGGASSDGANSGAASGGASSGGAA